MFVFAAYTGGKVIRGWHTLRHSFCSNCAAKGIDQRIINAWMGHVTEEMARRYQHLFPSNEQKAMAELFG
jgi:integrase